MNQLYDVYFLMIRHKLQVSYKWIPKDQNYQTSKTGKHYVEAPNAESKYGDKKSKKIMIEMQHQNLI